MTACAINHNFNNASTPFTFSAKEKDSETGFSYFGSRYYNSDLSIWLSVDPMSDKYPSLSPYVYCANNPIKLVDPNGEEIGDPLKKMKVRRNSTSNTFGLVRKNKNGTTRPHQGVDYYAPVGTPVYAVSNGLVVNTVTTDSKEGYGKSVTIQHYDKDDNPVQDKEGNNIYSFYAHLSEVGVKVGDMVYENTSIIGESGTTGNATGMTGEDQHLHFEIRTKIHCPKGLEGRLDPNDFVDSKFEKDPNDSRKVRMIQPNPSNNSQTTKDIHCIYK